MRGQRPGLKTSRERNSPNARIAVEVNGRVSIEKKREKKNKIKNRIKVKQPRAKVRDDEG
jgi:hypothetical protein